MTQTTTCDPLCPCAFGAGERNRALRNTSLVLAVPGPACGGDA